MQNNRTPLFWASARGHTKIVEILLKGGADFISRRKVSFVLMLATVDRNWDNYTVCYYCISQPH
jgi:ankyrin repeat protein